MLFRSGKIIGGGLPCGAVIGNTDLIDMGKTSGDPFLDYDSKAFVGGTMSGNSIVCASGKATIHYLKNNQHIYDEMQQKTLYLCNNFKSIAKSLEIAFQMQGFGSIFTMTFRHRPTKYYREKLSGSNFKANLALSYYMRKHGVYVPELHTLMLNIYHQMEDIDLATEAFASSLAEMRQDGFFLDD